MVSSIPLTRLVEQEDHTRWESGIPSQKAGPNAASTNKSQQASTEDLQVFLLTLHYVLFISIQHLHPRTPCKPGAKGRAWLAASNHLPGGVERWTQRILRFSSVDGSGGYDS